MRPAIRNLGIAAVLAAALVTVPLAVSKWWSAGERQDLASWAEVQHETAWLTAILEPDPEGFTPPCSDSIKLAVGGGTVNHGDSAQGEKAVTDAKARLVREGWRSLGRTKPDQTWGTSQVDWYERTISGRKTTVTFVGTDQGSGSQTVRRSQDESPAVMITMEAKFCGL
jgi:hypothetical protein